MGSFGKPCLKIQVKNSQKDGSVSKALAAHMGGLEFRSLEPA